MNSEDSANIGTGLLSKSCGQCCSQFGQQFHLPITWRCIKGEGCTVEYREICAYFVDLYSSILLHTLVVFMRKYSHISRQKIYFPTLQATNNFSLSCFLTCMQDIPYV